MAGADERLEYAVQVPVPPAVPVGLTPVAGTPTILMTIFSVLAVGLVGYALRDWRQRGQPVALALIVASVVTNLDEGVADHLGVVWYSAATTPVWYRSFVPMPVFMLPGYIVFFGGVAILAYRVIEARVSRRSFLLFALLCWTVDLCIEVPMLATRTYTFYGSNQPLSVGGLPVYWLTINTLGPVATAALVYKLGPLLTGARLVLVVPLMPMCYAAVVGAAGFPIFNLLHSAAPQWFVELGAVVTMALALSMWWIVRELTCRDGRWQRAYHGGQHPPRQRPGTVRDSVELPTG